MKKVLKYAGLCSAVLAVLTFIFMMAFNALEYKSGDTTTVVSGTRAIFGETVHGSLGDVTYKGAPTALIAWILVLVAVIILVAAVVLPLLKVNALEKFAGILNLVAVGALVTAGILLFFTQGAYNEANVAVIGETKVYGYSDFKLTFGYVLAAILAIVAGVVAVAPAAVDFIGGKKGK